MIDPEHRPLAIWAGGGVLALVLGAIALNVLVGSFHSDLAAGQRNYKEYQRWYPIQPPAGALPAQQAEQRAGQQQAKAASIWQQVKIDTVYPGNNRRVLPRDLGDLDLTQNVPYERASTRVSQEIQRLRQVLDKLNIGFEGDMPFESNTGIDHELESSERSKQLYQFASFVMQMELLVDAKVSEVQRFTFVNSGINDSPDGQLTILPSSIIFTARFPAVWKVLQELRNHPAGLFVAGVTMQPTDLEDLTDYEVELDVALAVPRNEAWPQAKANITAPSKQFRPEQDGSRVSGANNSRRSSRGGRR